MTAANFDKCLARVLRHEGGYVNDPHDPGGATNKGITYRTYNAWRARQGQPTRSVKQIGDDEVAAIYRVQYWDAIKGDHLPSGVDYAVFDYAVNSGPAQAIRDLQRCIGAKPDGVMGANSLAAMTDDRPAQIVAEICDRRLRFLKSLKTWGRYRKGWSARVADVREIATGMVEDHEPEIAHSEQQIDTAPKADPADASVTKTGEATGGAIATGGTLGSVVTEQAENISGLTSYSEIIKYVFIALILIGVAITFISLYRRMKAER